MTEPDFRGKVFAGCKISDKLGQGGMGTVYLAHHENLDKLVCVKLLSPDLARDQRNIDFFLREARSAAKLEHPNIVHIYNFGQENGSYFIVMSYIEGKSLQDILEQRGVLPVPEATELIAGILDGLAHAHSKSIIHRDIKPSNILVDKAGVPHIVDFGLARSLSEEKQLTMAGEMIGTAYFMSPEQCLAGQVDNRADLYSAGASYFYILTGKYPFDGKTSIEVIHKHISDPVPNPLLINPDIPLWASRVIERLMRKKPEDRYQKAEDVASELRKYNSGELNISQTSTEKTFDILTTPLMSSAPPPPPPPPGAGSAPAAPPPAPWGPPPEPQKEPAPVPKPGRKPAMQLAMLHNAVKIITHLALSLGAVGCFILAGASGKTPGSFSSPLETNPIVTVIFAVFGVALFTWALYMKPRKFTMLYALFAATAAAAAFAGGVYIPAPEGSDAATKGFLAITIGMENIASSTAPLIYAFFLYLLASKIVFRNSWVTKLLAIAAYAGGLALTFRYFGTGLQTAPGGTWLAAAGALSAAGLVAAIVQRQFSLIINPQLFFLAANLAVFAMFTNPQVEQRTREKVAADAETVNATNQRNRDDYKRAVEAAQAEVLYDTEGRPIEKKTTPPVEVKPQELNFLRNQARVEYYTDLSMRISTALADSAGIVFIGLFLALMANICFIEELFTSYSDTESFQ
ncbi:MAG TPA: serine/threonine-protein kinase [Elusimicrobiales bacterium]|nr:serine/threonine-protein kinase [Elusimicrobiales bacterium]